MSPRVSAVLPARAEPARRLADMLAWAQRLDDDPAWHGVWVPDSILALGYVDSTVALAALAARTRRLRLGVACLSSLGLRQPLVVAQQWANLDQLSDGRVTLVACTGNRTGEKHERERAAFGVDFATKAARTEDAVHFLRHASSHDTFGYHSPYLDLDDVALRPPFRQRPLPIWFVANPTRRAPEATVRRVLDRVARLGDGWLTFNVRPQDLAARVALLQELRSGHDRPFGPPPGVVATPAAPALSAAGTEHPVAVQVNVTVAAHEEDALEEAAAAWAVNATRGIDLVGLREVSAIGTPDQCAAFLRRLLDAGATDLLLAPLSTDPGGQLDRISRGVLPLVTGAAVASTGQGGPR